MKRTTIFAALLALFVTSGFAQRPPTLTDDDIAPPKPKEKEKPVPATTAAPATKTSSAWVEFSSEEGGFAVSLPGKPVERSQKNDSDSGPLDQKIFAVEKNGIFYGVIYFDLPAPIQSAEEMEMRLNGVRNRILNNGQVKLLGESAITLAGHSGREFRMKQAERVMTMRVIGVGRRCYSVMVVTKPEEDTSEATAQLFSSFRIVE